MRYFNRINELAKVTVLYKNTVSQNLLREKVR